MPRHGSIWLVAAISVSCMKLICAGDYHQLLIRETSNSANGVGGEVVSLNEDRAEGAPKKGGQLRISEPISNNNNTLVINTTYGPTLVAPVNVTWTGRALDEPSNEFSTESSANETTGTDFPLSSLVPIEVPTGQLNEDGLESGTFFMLNATCKEHEDPNCIIDHNITCVGDPIYCNLTYDEYLHLLYDYIYPSIPEWILICSHAVVFLMGLVSQWRRLVSMSN